MIRIRVGNNIILSSQIFQHHNDSTPLTNSAFYLLETGFCKDQTASFENVFISLFEVMCYELLLHDYVYYLINCSLCSKQVYKFPDGIKVKGSKHFLRKGQNVLAWQISWKSSPKSLSFSSLIGPTGRSDSNY